MKPLFPFRLLTIFSVLFVIVSCTKKLEQSLDITLNNNYPVIQIKSTFDNTISIVPINNLHGSIGYQIDSNFFWIKGLPKIEFSDETNITYIWMQDSLTQVILKLIQDRNTILFDLSIPNSEVTPNKWFINFQSTDNEFFTGIFERVVDGKQNASWTDSITTAINLRGEKMEVKLKPTVSAYAPFYISSNNYSFFAYGTWPGEIDFCKENKDIVKIAFEGPDFSFKLSFASNPLELVRSHALETGPSIIPPKWAFEPWRWRDQHFNKEYYYDKTKKRAPYNTDLVEDVLLMEAFDIPVGAHWIDRPWGPGTRGFDDYKFDTIAFPHPEEMIKWLNGKNQELMLWIGPFVMGDMADYAEENNYHLISKPWYNSRQILMDFTNAKAVKWWGENGPGKLAKMGVKGFKLDRADGEKLADSIHLKTSIKTTYRENFNDYPHQYVKATYEAVQPVLGDNFVLFPRAQYTGSSKYGAMWAGDTNGKPEGLRSAIIGMQRCAVMGDPIWGSDIGGYWGSFSRETAMRWLAFGCFSPLMECGPTNNLAFWSNPSEPNYDIELIATWRLYSKIRMQLIDYLHDLAKKANNDGTPIVLPLFLKYPNQQAAWADWQTYQLGPDILVSAIWKNEAVQHKLYLPAGETWIDAWETEKEYKGGNYITVDAPLHKMPVFIRKGSGIELGDLKKLYAESLKIASVKPDLAELEKLEGWK